MQFSGLVFAAWLCRAGQVTPFSPGWRNEFHAGLQQAFGKYVVFSGEYIWKYTHNAYDFSVLGSTPITFPIEWHNSKIPGFAGRVSVPNFHGFSALMVFSSVAARFFTPQIGGAGAVPSGTVGNAFTAFRIDHDERFNQTTHVQYQPWKRGPWVGFNWRYDSGLVAGEVPVADASGTVDLSGLTGDQQLQAGLFCGSARSYVDHAAGNLHFRLRVNPDQLAQTWAGERRQQSATRRSTQSLRSRGGRRQSLPRGTLQVEPAAYGHQCDQQSCALQLPVNLQRHSLRHAACPDRGAGVSFLKLRAIDLTVRSLRSARAESKDTLRPTPEPVAQPCSSSGGVLRPVAASRRASTPLDGRHVEQLPRRRHKHAHL